MEPGSIKENIFSSFKRGPMRTLKLKNTSEKSDFVKNNFFAIFMQNKSKIFFIHTKQSISTQIISIKHIKHGYEYICKTFHFWVKTCIFRKSI